MRTQEHKRILAIAACVLMLAGCATMGTNGNPTPTAAENFSAGAKWVMLITDTMVPVLCASNKLAAPTCATYTATSLQLKRQLLALDDLIAKGANPDTIAALVAQATATYLMIDAAYQGKLQP